MKDETLKKRVEWLEIKLAILEEKIRAKEMEERPKMILSMETATLPHPTPERLKRVREKPRKRRQGKRP